MPSFVRYPITLCIIKKEKKYCNYSTPSGVNYILLSGMLKCWKNSILESMNIVTKIQLPVTNSHLNKLKMHLLGLQTSSLKH